MNLFQKIAFHYSQKLPFVAYCKPNSNTMVGVFQTDDALNSITDFTENGFAFVSFDGNSKHYIPSENSDVYVEKVSSDTFYISKKNRPNTNELEKDKFKALVAKGIEAIEKGDFKKVVLSRKESFEIESIDFEQVLKSLHFNYPNAFNYCFFHPQIGMWIGASPEQFLLVSNGDIKTVALAGTQLYSEAISWESKEKQEQQYVADYIFASLTKFCTTISLSEPYTFKAGALAHIKTDISAVLDSKSDLRNLIAELHPTPAVCGLPKEEARQFILQHEGYDRKFYTGFLGELNIDFSTFKKESTDLFVNLRCMEVVNKIAHLYVGCGITKDSNPEKEYIETVNKSMTIRKVVNL